MITYNASLLKLAREQDGLTQKNLAEKLGVKQAVLSKYENGTIVPSNEMQQKISEVLNYPMSFFLQGDDDIPSGLAFHRKRSSLLSSVRLQIEAEVRSRSLDIIKFYKHSNLSSNIIKREGRSAKEMAKAIRNYWGVDHGPIDDLTALLEKNKIIVMQFDFQTDKLDGFFMPLPNGIVSIALNDNPVFSSDRRRHTLAHECGHALLEHYNDFPDDKREDEAEEFAGELLTPEEDIKNEFKPPLTLSQLREMKKKWKVSMGSLLFRAHKLGTIKDSMYRRTWMFLSSQGYKKREPDCGLRDEQPMLLKELVENFICIKNFLDELCISDKRFHDRYPWIKMEGQSFMAPMIS